MAAREGIRERRRRRQRRGRLNNRRNFSAPHIPKEVLEEIFHKLPLKPMFRLKVICKEWNSIISDPNFFDEDSRRRSRSNTYMILFYDSDTDVYALDFSRGPMLPTTTSRSEDAYNWFGCTNPIILGSYNGLVAVACDEEQYFLWNPLTREYNFFDGGDTGHLQYYESLPWILYGLCYDDSSDEYSIVITVQESHKPPIPPKVKTIITNLSTGAKKEIGPSALGFRLVGANDGEIGKVICGYPHWLLPFSYDFDAKPMQFRKEIIFFDFKHEVYKQLERPREAIGEDKTMVGLAALGGERELGMVLLDIPSSSFNVWVMKEYGNVESWTNLFVISTFDQITKFDHMEVLGFLPSGEILIDVNLKEFWAYDIGKGMSRQIQLDDNVSREKYVTRTCYYPSLVLPPGVNANEHRGNKSPWPEVVSLHPVKKPKRVRAKKDIVKRTKGKKYALLKLIPMPQWKKQERKRVKRTPRR